MAFRLLNQRTILAARLILAAIAAVFFLASIGAAQTSTSGSVAGTVTDPSGAVVPSASVEAVNTATGIVLRQTANASGQYVFPNLVPGLYTLKFSAPGFRSSTVNDLSVDVAKSYRQDIKLEV